MPSKSLKCPKCDRSFSLPGHLARHLSATHGVRGKGAKKKRGARRGPGRPPGSRNKTKPGASRGRPSGLVSRLGLRNMSLGQLSEVIDAARAEARRQLAGFRDMF
jgi:hypothetical protein